MLPDLERDGVRVFYLSSASPTPGVEALLPAIEAASDEPLPAWHRTGVTANSKAMYIYTSGTTGELGNLPGSALGGAMRSLRGWVRMGSLEGSWGGSFANPDHCGSTWTRCVLCPWEGHSPCA